MAEKLIVPGHIADMKYVIPAIQVYYQANDWLNTADYIDREFHILKANGTEDTKKKDNTDYTKDAELARYFGFVERKTPGDIRSDCRITKSGKAFYESYINNDYPTIWSILMDALENVTFGRNNEGCPNSNTRLEAPNILMISSLLLDGISRKEYASILFQMLKKSESLVNAIVHIKLSRLNNNEIVDTIRVDNKVIPFFVTLKFLEDVDGRLIISKVVRERYQERIAKLRPTNDEDVLFQADDLNFDSVDFNEPLQQIFYGAPGTGKSFKIDEMTQKYPTIRTTFHPDSDYSTFVGAYKPIMEDIDVKVTPVVVGNGISLQPSGTYQERRIAYKFVKQAFLKAYLGAWKKYVDHTSPTGSSNSTYVQITYKGKNFEDVFTLDLVTDNHVEYTKATIQSIDIFKTSVEKCWNKVFDSENINNMMYEAAACYWYNDNNPENPSFDNCWMAIMNELNQEKTIESSPGGSQTYLISKNEENIIIKTTAKASKIKIEERFNTQKNNSRSIQKLIADKLKEYNVDFGEAWKMLKKDVENSHQSNSNTNGSDGIPPQFLIIEEINRGNCAQIFGDIFQLLDRSDNKFSTYPIEADTDLQQEVSRAFKEDKEYKLLSNIEIEGKVKNYTSNYGANLSEDVQEGRVLLFPPNLYIWATMNTSDQSLFPIDSAFKRRWDWNYVKITDGKKGWTIKGSDYSCNWWLFIQEINKKIATATSSDDKKLGYFFCKAKHGETFIDEKIFVSKVIFYLWNDVFKDNDNTIFKVTDSSDEPSFEEFYMENEEGDIVPNSTSVKQFLINVVGEDNVTIQQSQNVETEQDAKNEGQELELQPE